MKVLSREETVLWCDQHEIALNKFGLPEHSDASAKFIIPKDAQKRVGLVSQGMAAFGDAPFSWFGSTIGLYGHPVNECTSSTGSGCHMAKAGG
jgi:hypothetical protein